MIGPVFERFDVDPIQEAIPGAVRRLGGWQIRAWGEYAPSANGQPIIISPLHGRAGIVLDEQLGYVSIKGLGWTQGPLCLLNSPKDARLYFGLYPERDALREWNVSCFLHSRGIGATRVLGFARNEGGAVLGHNLFMDGSPIQPCLLYTQALSPYRVADLPWLAEAQRSHAVAEVCAVRNWPIQDFVEKFCKQMLFTMADYHRHGCINDSLSPDNITLAAEVTDFEWFTTPDHALPDGSLHEEAAARRRKEIVYGYEISCMLCDALNLPAHKRHVLGWMTAGYRNGDKNVEAYLRSLIRVQNDFAA